MGRIARVVAVDLPHRISQRGNFRIKVFGDDGFVSRLERLLLRRLGVKKAGRRRKEPAPAGGASESAAALRGPLES